MYFIKKIEIIGVRLAKKMPFLYPIGKAIIRIADQFLLQYYDFRRLPLLIVYQQGRVASTSVYEALIKKNLGLPVLHLHFLNRLEVEREMISSESIDFGSHRNHDLSRAVIRSLEKRNKSPERFPKSFVVSIYRDPLEIMLSLIVLHARRGSFCEISDYEQRLMAIQDNINREDPQNWHICRWFEDSFSIGTGIQIFEEKIDHDKGYTIVENNNFRTVIFNFSRMNDCFSDGISELLCKNVGKLSISHSNIHRDKSMDDFQIYLKKNFRVKEEFWTRLMKSSFMVHFFAESEREEMRRRWVE